MGGVMAEPGVTLEITVAPVDLPHATHILPHQLRQWAGQVDEVIFTLDLHTSRGRYGHDAEARKPKLRALLDELCARYPHARVEVVDYSPEAMDAVGRMYFGGRAIPPKHHYGGPFYSYFFGLHAASHDHVLHLDSDMLFGGGSQTWIAQAVGLLERRTDVLLASPLPGPPTRDGVLAPSVVARHGWVCMCEPPPRLAYGFRRCTTRLFLIDLARFRERMAPLPLSRPRLRSSLRAWAEGQPPYALPEEIISALMAREGMLRIGMLGEPPGMWSLHPALRSELFYRELPALIRRIEDGDVPDAQRGDFDMNDSMIDWTSARGQLASGRWWRRLLRENRWYRRV